MSRSLKEFTDWRIPFEFEPRVQPSDYRLIFTGTSATYFRFGFLAGTINRAQPSQGTTVLTINRLNQRSLKTPLDIIVEPDDGGFIAKTSDLPLYGYGDDREEAIANLKIEIESLYDDLMEDDQFSEEWVRIKSFLEERIVN